MTREAAKTIALQALAWLAEDSDRLVRFMGLTGITPDALRGGAGDPLLLAGVLDYLLAHESLLLDFTAAAGVSAELPARARPALPGVSPEAN